MWVEILKKIFQAAQLEETSFTAHIDYGFVIWGMYWNPLLCWVYPVHSLAYLPSSCA